MSRRLSFGQVGWGLFLTLALVASATPAALSQTSTGSIRGYVTDEAGSALAGTALGARNLATGEQVSGTTGSNGFYFLAGLRPGNYEVTARRIGVTPQVRRVEVGVGQVLTVDFRLGSAAVQLSEVVVSGEALEARTSEVGTNVTQAQVENLPTTSRNFLDLATLAPGIHSQGTRLNDTRRTFAAGAQPAEQVNVFVDGASYKNDVLQGGVAGQDASRGNPFPLNAVQEFRVITQQFKAEYQKASSAIIAATTRSGGNQWDGNALFLGMGKGLIAQDTFAIANKLVKPDFTRYLAGLSIGGPIVRGRLRFFGSFETNRQDRVETVTFPTLTADTVNFAPYQGSFTSPFRSNLFFGKLSYEPSKKQSLDLSFNVRHETDIRDFGGGISLQAANNVKNDVNTATLKHRWEPGGPWLNEATVTWQWYHWNPVPTNPQLVGRNYDGIGRLGGKDTEQDFKQDRGSFRDDVTYSGLHWRGQHVLKAGANLDFLRYHVNKLFNGNPVFAYSGDTALGHYSVRYQAPYQANYGFGNPDLSAHNTELGAYVQDDWSPTRRLILNLGVRWDYESNMLDNNYVTPRGIVDSLQLPIFKDSVLFPIPSSYFTDGTQRPAFLGAFQPRLGLSYDLDENGRWTLFGGFGVYYDRDYYNATLDERFRLQYKVLTFLFSSDGSPRNGSPTISWQDSYLSKQGLNALVASGQAPKPEIYLINNNTRPPHSHQFSYGVRHAMGNAVLSIAYTGVRSYNGITYIRGNRRANGDCCYQIAGGSFSNVLLSSDEVRTWYDALMVRVDRPYRGGKPWAWGGGVSYTLGKATQIGGDLFSLDFAHVTDYPRYPSPTDQRHTVVANGIVDIPGSIQLSGVITLGTGTPYDIADASLGFGPNQFKLLRGAGRPDKNGFIIPNFWGYRDVDVRVKKSLPRFAGTGFDILAEVFNAFNYQNYGCYDGFIRPLTDPAGRNPNFGKPGCVVSDGRRFQLGAQYSF